jgi:hypothetical protein
MLCNDQSFMHATVVAMRPVAIRQLMRIFSRGGRDRVRMRRMGIRASTRSKVIMNAGRYQLSLGRNEQGGGLKDSPAVVQPHVEPTI